MQRLWCFDRDRVIRHRKVFFKYPIEDARDVRFTIACLYGFTERLIYPGQLFKFFAKVGLLYLIHVLPGRLSGIR